tara:strand:+ start:109392 stop:109775 length:384 start_codon:yes stop_codon:yes gene_type:complete
MSLHGSTSSLGSVLDTALSQTVLHGQLAWLELTEEKNRIFRQLALMLCGFLLLFCSLLSVSTLIIILSWGTPWLIPVIVLQPLIYMIGAMLSLHRFRQVQASGDQAFSDTRRELAADLELMRNGREK